MASLVFKQGSACSDRDGVAPSLCVLCVTRCCAIKRYGGLIVELIINCVWACKVTMPRVDSYGWGLRLIGWSGFAKGGK